MIYFISLFVGVFKIQYEFYYESIRRYMIVISKRTHTSDTHLHQIIKSHSERKLIYSKNVKCT